MVNKLVKAAKDDAEAWFDQHDGEGGDDATETDEADQWLKENADESERPSKPEQSDAPKEKKAYSKDWEPGTYTPEQQSKINALRSEGYSHREAEHMAGAYKGPKNYQEAMKSRVKPSMPSEKMLNRLKELSGEWLQNAKSNERANADEMKSPIKYAAGQMEQAHKAGTANFQAAYNDFLQSDSVKNLSPRERHGAVQKWKSDWKAQNPEHDAGLQDVSKVQAKFADADKNIKDRNDEIADHIGRGGVSNPAEMSDEVGLQNLGGGKDEEGKQTGTIIKDPLTDFAAKNPRYAKMLSDEQMERLNRVNSAAAAQGKVRSAPSTDPAAPAAAPAEPFVPKTVIRRPGGQT